MNSAASIRSFLAPAAALAFAVASSASASPTQHNLAISLQGNGTVPAPVMHFEEDELHGPDLTLTDVSIEEITLRDGSPATRLRVTVVNVGNAHWKSERYQQALIVHAGDEPFLMSTNLRYLRAGASRTFSVKLPKFWDAAAKTAPDLTIELVTDEDSHIDGNPANDDADETANLMILPGTTVNHMIGH